MNIFRRIGREIQRFIDRIRGKDDDVPETGAVPPEDGPSSQPPADPGAGPIIKDEPDASEKPDPGEAPPHGARPQRVGIFWTPLLCLPNIEAQAGAMLREARQQYDTLLCVVDLATNTRDYIVPACYMADGYVRPGGVLIANLRYLHAMGWRVIVAGANEPSTRKNRSQYMAGHGFVAGRTVADLYSTGSMASWAFFWSVLLAMPDAPWGVMPVLEPTDVGAQWWTKAMAAHIRATGYKGRIYQSALEDAQDDSGYAAAGMTPCTSRAGTAKDSVKWEAFRFDAMPMRDGDDWDYGRDRYRIPELVRAIHPQQDGCIPLYLHDLEWDARMLEGLPVEPAGELPDAPEPFPIEHPTVSLMIDYGRDWDLWLTGRFFRGEKDRIIRTGDINGGLDFFFWRNFINVRLFNRKIRFTRRYVGLGAGEGDPIVRESDHWASTLPVNITDNRIHEMRLGCTAADRRFRVLINGVLVADYSYDIVSPCPNRTRLILIGFRGSIVQTVPVQTTQRVD